MYNVMLNMGAGDQSGVEYKLPLPSSRGEEEEVSFLCLGCESHLHWFENDTVVTSALCQTSTSVGMLHGWAPPP